MVFRTTCQDLYHVPQHLVGVRAKPIGHVHAVRFPPYGRHPLSSVLVILSMAQPPVSYSFHHPRLRNTWRPGIPRLDVQGDSRGSLSQTGPISRPTHAL